MTKKSLLGTICAVLFAGTSVFAQDSQAANDFGYTGTLLNPVNPRAAGMGMAAAAVNDNPFGIFGNAAANLFSEKELGAGFSYNPWMSETAEGAASLAVGAYYNIDGNNGISFGFSYGNHGKVAGVNPADLTVSLAYTRRIVDNFAISLTARYINANSYKMDDHKAANGVAFDLGLYYNNTIESFFGSTWAVGLNVSNLGTELDFGGPQYSMPAYATLGGSIDMPFSVNHRLLAAVDFGYTFMPSDAASFIASVGAEYNFLRYGIVRAGYHYGDELSMGGSYGTVGLGVKVGPVRVDASYWLADKESPVKNTWSVGVGLFF